MADEVSQPDPAKILQDFLDKENLVLSVIPRYLRRDDSTYSTIIDVKVDFKNNAPST